MSYHEGDLLCDNTNTPLNLFGLDYTEMVFVAAKGKTFTLGEDNNKTQITFDQDYFIGKYAVTQALYEKVMGKNPSRFKGKHRPVEMVSWNDITQQFLPKLNELIENDSPKLNGKFGLPSEAQWEYAAAGGQAWNSPKLEYAGSNNLNDVGWFNENAGKHTFPVGLKQPNALGLHDMSGNVWEWCQDEYTSSLNNLPKNGLAASSQKDNNKVLRGGGYFSHRFSCRVRFRYDLRPDDRLINFNGFRLVFSPVQNKTNLWSVLRDEERRNR